MSEFQIFVIAASLLTVMFSLGLAKKFYSSLHHSYRMVMAMFSGTSIGLVTGVMIGSHMQGNLFFSTSVGILGGALLGGLCGWNLGVVACLEGLISGLMGGMMGSMLGEMISFSESLTFIKFFLTLAVSSLMLYPIFINISSHNHSIQSKKWLLKPLLIFLLVLSFLVAGSLLNEEPMNRQDLHQHHSP